MWTIKAIGAPTAEPVDLPTARRQCRVGLTDETYDPDLTRLILVARDHVEKYCGMMFATRSVTLKCSAWDDLASLPLAPLNAVTSIKYVDEAGDQQTVADTVYEEGGDRFSSAVVLKAGQAWPVSMDGSSIELVATFGGDVPPSVQHAMLMLLAHLFVFREAVSESSVTTVPIAFDDLLANDRRYS